MQNNLSSFLISLKDSPDIMKSADRAVLASAGANQGGCKELNVSEF